ncbi:hypothetical protein Tco_0145590 [Tanacetum coccineum]
MHSLKLIFLKWDKLPSDFDRPRTYLEHKFENFTSSSQDDLIKDALFAIRDTLQDEKLTSSVCIVSFVGVEPGGGAAAKEDAAPIDI